MAFEGTQASPQPRGPVSVDELSRKYGAVLVRYFRRRGIQLSDAQDLAQDVFYRLTRQGSLEGVENVENYLFTTAANVARDMYRKDRVRSDNPAELFVESLQVTQQFPVDRELASKQELDLVLASLNEMPERMRTIFILARLEDMPRGEIAARLGVSKSTVEQAITRATACLAERRSRYS